MPPTTDAPYGAMSIWPSVNDDRYICHWQVHQTNDEPYLTWTVTVPGKGSKETEEDPILEGLLTRHRGEFHTIGSVDFGDLAPGVLAEILETVLGLKRHL